MTSTVKPLSEMQEAVLNVIRYYDGACARTFAQHDLYRFGARIHELRQMGYQIEKQPCKRHHHKSTLWLYRII